MNKLTYTIAQRPYSIFDGETDLADKPILFDLSYLDLLLLEGEKSADFLQGQLSCDIRRVTETQMQPGAMCNLKGRILALLDVLYWQQHYYLLLPKDLSLDTLSTLNKVAPLSRVKLKSAEKYHIFGLYMPENSTNHRLDLPLPNEPYQAITTDGLYCYALDKECYLLIVDQNQSDKIRLPFQTTQHVYGSLAWHRLQLSRKCFEIYPQSRGLFLPHRVDLHKTAHLSFDKGCYKGQEIIARTHYRATLKHGLNVFKVQAFENLQIGEKLFDKDSDIEVGELIDFCPLGEKEYVIVVSILFDHPEIVRFESSMHEVRLDAL